MRKGQIFSMDIIIACVILVLGIAILFYQYPFKSKSYYNSERLSEDILSVLTETKISDLCKGPGEATASGCECTNYEKLEHVVCNPNIKDKDADILSFFTEVSSNGYCSREDISAIIHEIFVDKNVIDEKRFGFAVLYTTASHSNPLEMYNTETYHASP